MPENAKVLVVEDNNAIRYLICSFLKEAGHSIIAEVETVQGFFELLPCISKNMIDAVVLDGNLTPDDGSGTDGKRIAYELRKYFPGIKIIEYSIRQYGYGDVSVIKGPTGPEKLCRVISNF